MVGTFGGALEARKINASGGALVADVRGEVEKEDGTLVIRRVHVQFTLRGVPPDALDTIDRVHGMYAEKCPVYKTLKPAIAITSSYELQQS